MKDKEAKARGLAATFRTHATKLKEQLADAAADAAAREDEVAEARRHQAKVGARISQQFRELKV
eukprot:scaffold544_cov256-Pinguiococcus_pyrenoidosus.AAC.9